MTHLSIGDPVPWFALPSSSNPNFKFDTVGGYSIVLCFFGSTKHQTAQNIVQGFCKQQALFDRLETPWFGISTDPADKYLTAAIEIPTFCKFMWDFQREISRLYGVIQVVNGEEIYTPVTLVLDQRLRVLRVFPFETAETHVASVMAFLQQLPAIEPPQLSARQAPVLFIPRVFSPEFCQRLINLYETNGGQASGFMRDINGKTVEVLDDGFKKRRDFNLVDADPKILQTVNELIIRRVKPEIEKVFQFAITRFERYLIACYEAENQGFFRRHRDNTTLGTIHRRFAMSLNLNTGDYEGGYLRFPEYGTQLYAPDAGEAVIFSCSLLHEATPVTAGRRFTLLSFFYDDADAKVREQNRKYLANHHPEATDTEPTDTTRTDTTRTDTTRTGTTRAGTVQTDQAMSSELGDGNRDRAPGNSKNGSKTQSATGRSKSKTVNRGFQPKSRKK